MFCGLLLEVDKVPVELTNESSEYFLLSKTGILELSPELAKLGSGFMEKLGLRLEDMVPFKTEEEVFILLSFPILSYGNMELSLPPPRDPKYFGG